MINFYTIDDWWNNLKRNGYLSIDRYWGIISYYREATDEGCQKTNKEVIDDGIFEKIWAVLTKCENEDLMHQISWIFLNLTKCKSNIMFKYLQSNHALFEHIGKMLQSKNKKTLENTLWSFANLTRDGQELIKVMLRTQLIECIQTQVESDHAKISILRAWARWLANLMKYKNKSQNLIAVSIYLLNTLLQIRNKECRLDSWEGFKNLLTMKESSEKSQTKKLDLLASSGVI